MALSPAITALLPHCRAVNSSDKVTFCCPVHADEHQSAVAFPRDDGGVTLHCSAGCDPRQIASVLGIDTRGTRAGGAGRSYGASRKHGAKRLDFGPKTPTTTFGRDFMRAFAPCRKCGCKGCKKPECDPPKPAACNADRDNVTADVTASTEDPAAFDPAELDAAPADDSLFHLAARFAQQAAPEALGILAAQLGVAADALEEIGLGWNHLPDDRRQSRSGGVTILPPCWTFPEKDGAGNVVGIGERYADGKKKFMFGTHRGLIYADSLYDMVRACGYVLLVEGPTDVAACLSIGLPAVGRPSNTGGVAQLADLIHRLFHDFPNLGIFVVGENDKRSNGEWPGQIGANQTAINLVSKLNNLYAFNPGSIPPSVRVVFPPDGIKDTRSWVNQINPDYSDKNSKTSAANALMAVILGAAYELKHRDKEEHSRNSYGFSEQDLSRYEEKTCPNETTQILEGINGKLGQASFIRVRCHGKECRGCWPSKISRWLVRVFGRLVGIVTNKLYQYSFPSETPNKTIANKVARRDGVYAIIDLGTSKVLVSSVELSKKDGVPRIIDEAGDLFIYLHQTIASIPFGLSRAVTTSYDLKTPDGPKVQEWKHIGQVSGSRYHVMKTLVGEMGFQPVRTKVGGDRVVSYHVFRFPDHFDAATRELHLRWLMLGQRPPSCGRMPTGWDILQVWQPVHTPAAT